MAKPVAVSDGQFEEVVLKAGRPVLVDFWAPWCGPCRAVAPVVEELTKDFEGKVDFVKVNVDESPTVAAKYSIMSIPTLMIFKDGKPVQQFIGFRPKGDFQKALNNFLKDR
jgi:thioredoxin 1